MSPHRLTPEDRTAIVTALRTGEDPQTVKARYQLSPSLLAYYRRQAAAESVEVAGTGPDDKPLDPLDRLHRQLTAHRTVLLQELEAVEDDLAAVRRTRAL